MIEAAHRIGFRGLMLGGDGLEQALLHSIMSQSTVAQLRAGETDEGVEIFRQDGGGISHDHTLAEMPPPRSIPRKV